MIDLNYSTAVFEETRKGLADQLIRNGNIDVLGNDVLPSMHDYAMALLAFEIMGGVLTQEQKDKMNELREDARGEIEQLVLDQASTTLADDFRQALIRAHLIKGA